MEWELLVRSGSLSYGHEQRSPSSCINARRASWFCRVNNYSAAPGVVAKVQHLASTLEEQALNSSRQ